MGASVVREWSFSLALLIGSPLTCQTVVWQVTGSGDDIFKSARWLGDVNADGVGDVLVVVKNYAAVGFGEGLWLLSGVDGRVVRVGQVLASWQHYYRAWISAGDVNGDGVGDYAVTVDRVNTGNFENLVQVLSGRDDTVLWQVEGPWDDLFGISLLGDVDVDGDNRPDLVLTAPSAPLFARVHAYANGGRLIWTAPGGNGLQPYAVAFRQSRLSLGKVGDVDGDGLDEIAIDCGHGGISGAAVLAGKDGQVLVAGFGLPGDAWGEINDGCGDMDGDGVRDFTSGQDSFGAAGGAGVWSGATGASVRTWRSERALNKLGAIISSKGLDIDRDGIPDVGVGEPDMPQPVSTGAIHLFSGRDGSELMTIVPRTFRPLGLLLGRDFELVPPQGTDPFPLLLVFDGGPPGGPNQPCNQFGFCGRVTLLRLNAPGVAQFGLGCRGSLTQTPQIGVQSLPGKTRIHLAGGQPGANAALVLGFSNTNFGSVSLPLALKGFASNCQLLVSPDVVAIALVETGRRAGYASVDLPLPLATPGSVTIYGQWIALGTEANAPGGVSDALLWRH